MEFLKANFEVSILDSMVCRVSNFILLKYLTSQVSILYLVSKTSWRDTPVRWLFHYYIPFNLKTFIFLLLISPNSISIE
mgnify:CR=1 FL=1